MLEVALLAVNTGEIGEITGVAARQSRRGINRVPTVFFGWQHWAQRISRDRLLVTSRRLPGDEGFDAVDNVFSVAAEIVQRHVVQPCGDGSCSIVHCGGGFSIRHG
jgi:hypothetical protein